MIEVIRKDCHLSDEREAVPKVIPDEKNKGHWLLVRGANDDRGRKLERLQIAGLWAQAKLGETHLPPMEFLRAMHFGNKVWPMGNFISKKFTGQLVDYMYMSPALYKEGLDYLTPELREVVEKTVKKAITGGWTKAALEEAWEIIKPFHREDVKEANRKAREGKKGKGKEGEKSDDPSDNPDDSGGCTLGGDSDKGTSKPESKEAEGGEGSKKAREDGRETGEGSTKVGSPKRQRLSRKMSKAFKEAEKKPKPTQGTGNGGVIGGEDVEPDLDNLSVDYPKEWDDASVRKGRRHEDSKQIGPLRLKFYDLTTDGNTTKIIKSGRRALPYGYAGNLTRGYVDGLWAKDKMARGGAYFLIDCSGSTAAYFPDVLKKIFTDRPWSFVYIHDALNYELFKEKGWGRPDYKRDVFQIGRPGRVMPARMLDGWSGYGNWNDLEVLSYLWKRAYVSSLPLFHISDGGVVAERRFTLEEMKRWWALSRRVKLIHPVKFLGPGYKKAHWETGQASYNFDYNWM